MTAPDHRVSLKEKTEQWQTLCQVPTKAALSTYSMGQTRQNITKGSWDKIRAERELSNYCPGQNRFDLGKTNLIYYPSNPGRVMRKIISNLKTLSPPTLLLPGLN